MNYEIYSQIELVWSRF